MFGAERGGLGTVAVPGPRGSPSKCYPPPMIDVGTTAPTFSRLDHLGRPVDLAAERGHRHVLLLFYPLDFTPT